MTDFKTEEKNVLIARRVPPGDRYRLIANEPDGPIHKSLTDTLEAYMVKTGFKGNYRLEPLQSLFYIDAIGMTWEQMKDNYLKEVGR